MNKLAAFLVNVLRLMLQIIGTYFVGKWVLDEMAKIPGATWGMMILTVSIAITLLIVWVRTLVDTFKKPQRRGAPESEE